MSDPVRELYSQHRYPALSHPETHPAKLCVAARVAGLTSPALPENCQLLEVGCASGHNLLPLAVAYPESQFTGIDFSDIAIRSARRSAKALGLTNITFDHADLCEWDPGEREFDYLVAHGMLSWIPEPAKDALFSLAAKCLAPDGVACIGYNTLPGWSLRQEAASMVKALAALTPEGKDLDALLAHLAETAALSDTPYARHLADIYADMRRKGPQILHFDDLGPRCDPLHFGQVIAWASEKQLRYLGESTLPANLPPGLSPEALTHLRPLADDPVLFQQTLDLLSGRTHRSSIFCHLGRPLDPATTVAVVLHFSARLLDPAIPSESIKGEIVGLFHASLTAATPSSQSIRGLMEDCAKRLGPRWEPTFAAKEIASWLYQAARLGQIELRADEIRVDPSPPAKPSLSPLNLHFARNAQPLVDAFHHSCDFPDTHRQIAAALNGSRSHQQLEALARDTAPELDFTPWLRHLSSRGLISGL